MVFHRAERGNVVKWLDPRGRGLVGFLLVRQWPAASRGTSLLVSFSLVWSHGFKALNP